MPLYPKVLRARERAPTLYFSVVFTLDSHLSLSRRLENTLNCAFIFILFFYAFGFQRGIKAPHLTHS
jgi:hypothetical protein